ncbi:MAG TPA: hypothetical protein VFV86_07650 [Nitrososphaeraceae archaeon]|nr:hypothetical protein [Nitrososphaeraceae archaeon]
MTKVSKTRSEKLYKSEHDINVKERMLLVLNVVYYKRFLLHRWHEIFIEAYRTCASDWLKRYREEGIGED